MKLRILSLFCALASLQAIAQHSAPDMVKTSKGALSIQPIEHASLVLSINGTTIYADPSGGAEHYKGIAAPNIILITDIHGDHFDIKTIDAIKTATTILIVPQAVADKIPAADKKSVVVINNGAHISKSGIDIDAIPMYCT